ncbi:MAG: helix-hairpin-helix domain-containing protein [Candidatus Omnitrophica bacterium]|nr:helix-hairpin-helix domain-containing protein [Candidatus Omnitrophota bacterium]
MLYLTKQERLVILFFIGIIILGISLNLLFKLYSPFKAFLFSEDAIKIDINCADKETLISLPGIGERLAQRIIEYRTNNQGFKDLEELKKIKGIGIEKYETIKEYFKIR